jgi:Carboxypeptidase regulatory-like domain
MIRLSSIVLTVFGLLAISAPLLGQQGQFSVSGTIVNSQTGEVLRNAMVTLFKQPDLEKLKTDVARGAAIQPVNSRVVTLSGPAGEFQFNGLTAGSYSVAGQKAGFTPTPTPQPPALSELTSSVTGVTLRLAPLGVIEGRVISQDGELMYGVRMEAIVTNVNGGMRQAFVQHTAITDDRGVFRLAGLQPGQYYLKAAGRGVGTYMYVGDATNRPQSWLTFSPVYFGGSHTLSAATPVTIDVGTETRADFRLDMEPAVDIRGTLENFTPHQTVAFSLAQSEEDLEASARVNLNGTTGAFVVQGVTPGEYILRATQGLVGQGDVRVRAGAAGADGVAVPLWRAASVKGSVRIIGAAPKHKTTGAASDDDDEEQPDPLCVVGLAKPAVMGRQSSGGGLRGPDFTIENVFPGEYRVHIECHGGYAISAMTGSNDLLANPRIVIQPGATPAPIEIALKPGGGSVHGTIAIQPTAEPLGDGLFMVLLVPAFSPSTGPSVTFATPDDSDSREHLEFEASALAPGDYTAYAFRAVPGIEYANPAVLQSLTGGTSVRVEDGKTAEITLKPVVK